MTTTIALAIALVGALLFYGAGAIRFPTEASPRTRALTHARLPVALVGLALMLGALVILMAISD
jgi:hypothetical protein